LQSSLTSRIGVFVPLAKDGIIPKAEKGKYDLIAATRAYIKYLQERATGRDIEPQDTYVERARLLKAQADKTELP
jgi:phage terminase Nu1 subunit (DNA packaging protein)